MSRSTSTKDTTAAQKCPSQSSEQNKELQKLRAENQRLKDALNAVSLAAGEKSSYYFNLVWRARRTAEDIAGHGFHEQLKERPDYADFLKDEANLLNSCDEVRYYHEGFYSGCYATARLFMGLAVVDDQVMCDHAIGDPCNSECIWTAEQERQMAWDDFPLLDT